MRSCRELFTMRAFYFKIVELVLLTTCKLNGMRGPISITNRSHLSNAEIYRYHECFALTSASGAIFMLIVFILAYIIDESNHFLLEMLFLFIYAFLVAIAGVFLIIEAEYLRTTIGGVVAIFASFLMIVDAVFLHSRLAGSQRISD